MLGRFAKPWLRPNSNAQPINVAGRRARDRRPAEASGMAPFDGGSLH